MRAFENPALDVALTVANARGIPVFVYHALSERYPYASDRHHTFILEGARDFAAALRSRGIGTAFHLERGGHRGPHLVTLAADAALVVTERMPVAPLTEWTAQLALQVAVPVWEVDTSCIVPLTLTERAYERAFEYRDATKWIRAERLGAAWCDVEPLHAAFVPALPFEPVDLQTADVAALVSTCDIDHAVGPVPHTRGGTASGMARWREFVDGGALAAYDRTRNDPTHLHGVSRMSPYLHYGMVSPFALAREAHALPGTGPAKWLDELLVWREVAYTLCHHRPDHASLTAIPAWAREALQAHAADPRVVRDHEQLARGRTGDVFWDAMQRSLLAHGELHNNVRMTWGKAIPFWTADAQQALDTLIDLNHRYALDGRDPASFGGLLWCLGQFDRPFTPEQPVLGRVRGRAIAGQAERVNVPAYVRHVGRPTYLLPEHGGRAHGPRVAVVGAGVAGLLCARTLADHGIDVVVFEKSRGLGGRCATRRESEWQFDHGAQYFTSRNRTLAPLMEAWRERGLIAEWRARIAVHESGTWRTAGSDATRWVAVPGMSALGRHLAADVTVRTGSTVTAIEATERTDAARDIGAGSAGDSAGGADPAAHRRWRVCGTTPERPFADAFDLVLVTAPAPQARALLETVAPALAARAADAIMHPVWATMLRFDERHPLPYDAAFVNDSEVLSWMSRDGSKPGRARGSVRGAVRGAVRDAVRGASIGGAGADTWVLHARREWSVAHLERDAEFMAAEMVRAFRRLTGLPEPVHSVAHRWRYAIPDPPLVERALFDPVLALGAAGDWCGGPRVEGAMLSGIALAGRVMSELHQRSTHAHTPHAPRTLEAT